MAQPDGGADFLRVRRATSQLLSGSDEAHPERVVQRLLAVQAQDLRGARLALRARSRGLTATEVDRALTVERSLVVAWLARGTLHLVDRHDYPWLLSLTAPTRLAVNRRRLGEEGVADDAERAVSIIERVLAEEGPLTRPQLAERLVFYGISTKGQAAPHLLMLAALRGIVVLGPIEGGRQAFVLTEDWLGVRPRAQRDRDRNLALAELARRYLAAHGPAAPRDLARWAGLALRDARAGLALIANELVRLAGDLVDLEAKDPAPTGLPPRLLPAFDPYILGWRDRSFAIPAEHARRVHPGGGVLRAVAVVDGRVVGTWRTRRRGTRLAGDIDLFSPAAVNIEAALKKELVDVARFEGLQT